MTEMHHNLEISTCDPLKHKMNHPMLILSHAWENPSEWKGFRNKNSSYLDIPPV